jgi:predicted DNA-binding protein
MEISLAPEVEARLARIASEEGKAANQVVQELVASYLDHDEWFRREVQKGWRRWIAASLSRTRKWAAKLSVSSGLDVMLSEAERTVRSCRRSRSIPTPAPNAEGVFFCCDIHHSCPSSNPPIMPSCATLATTASTSWGA